MTRRADVTPGSRWTHYRGGTYVVQDIATESDRGLPVVVYRSEDTGALFTRDLTMFLSSATTDDGDVPRYEPAPPLVITPEQETTADLGPVNPVAVEAEPM